MKWIKMPSVAETEKQPLPKLDPMISMEFSITSFIVKVMQGTGMVCTISTGLDWGTVADDNR